MQIESNKSKVQRSTLALASLIAVSLIPAYAPAHFATASASLGASAFRGITAEDRQSQEALQHLVMSLLRSLGTDNPDLNSLRQIKEIRSSAEDLLQRFPDKRPSDVSDEDRPFYNGIRSLRIQYAALIDKIASAYPLDEPKSILNTVSTLDSLTQRAVSEAMTTTFKIGIPRKVKALEARIFAYRTLVGGKASFRTDIVSRAQQQLATTGAAENSLSNEIIESNLPPQDGYQGSDSGYLDQLGVNSFSDKFQGVRVIDVVLPEKSWTSQYDWKYDAGSWRLASSAQMKAYALVQGDAEQEAWIIPFHYGRSSAVIGEVYCKLPEKLERPGPAQIVALSKAVRLAGSPR